MVTTKSKRQIMASHYTRKAVPLVVHGLANDQARIPMPESANETFFGYSKSQSNAHYRYVEPAFSTNYSTVSSRTSPIISDRDGAQSTVSVSNGWTTGNSTERSSIYTLGEDEFDKANSQRVRQLFNEIDSMLFETDQGPEHLFSECQQWTSKFPHLRLLGFQLVPPQDVGYQVVAQTPRPGSASNMLVDVTEQDHMHDLSITGRHLAAVQPPVDTLYLLKDRKEEFYPYEKEEVFAQDGFVEDIIAVDYKSPDEDSGKQVSRKMNDRQRRISGLPPITPHACVRDNIGSSTFDIIWSEVVGIIRQLTLRYSETLLSDVEYEDSSNRLMALPDMFPYSFGDPQHDMTPSREVSLISNTARPERFSRLQGLSQIQEQKELDGLLTISSKTLINREKSNLAEGQLVEAAQLNSLQYGQPGSSFTRFGQRPLSVKILDQSGRLTSARQRTATRGRLAPLERTKTPNADDEKTQMKPNEVLRGRGLSTMAERLASPPSPSQRFNTLPPIALEREETAPLPQKKKTHFSMRASSAIHDKESRIISFKDRDRMTVPLDARPSTTHTLYRSETPFGTSKRSSTPLGYTSTRVPPAIGTLSSLASSPQTNILQLNVTGNSINPQNEPDIQVTDSVDLDDTADQIEDLTDQQWGTSSQLPRRKSQYKMGSVR